MKTKLIEILQSKYPEYCMKHYDTADEIIRLLGNIKQPIDVVIGSVLNEKLTPNEYKKKFCIGCLHHHPSQYSGNCNRCNNGSMRQQS